MGEMLPHNDIEETLTFGDACPSVKNEMFDGQIEQGWKGWGDMKFTISEELQAGNLEVT